LPARSPAERRIPRVIGRGIEPASFEPFFASVALGADAAIAMHHRNGTRLPAIPTLTT